MSKEKEKPRTKSANLLARHLLRKCKIDQPPILIRDAIHALRYEDWDLDLFQTPLPEELSGILVTVEDSEVRIDQIHVNEDHHVHRKRFSAAHELGHLLLNTTHTKGLSNTSEEIEANTFAAELLMPVTLLSEDVKGKEITADLIPALAKKYFVSKEAMSRRVARNDILKLL